MRSLIEDTRANVATTFNAALTMLYWRVGKLINGEILQGERTDYGEAIVATVSRQLVADYEWGDAPFSGVATVAD